VDRIFTCGALNHVRDSRPGRKRRNRPLPIANIAELSEGIEEIERAAIDLVDSLNPATVPYPSYPNREGIYLNLGKVSNAVIGFIFGLAAVAILLIVILAGGL